MKQEYQQEYQQEYRRISDPSQVTHLVFNGGGVKGAAHPMAFAAFLACGGQIENIEAVAGASAGSIMASFVALGYTPEEMHYEMGVNFMDLLEADSGLDVIKTAKNLTDSYHAIKTIGSVAFSTSTPSLFIAALGYHVVKAATPLAFSPTPALLVAETGYSMVNTLGPLVFNSAAVVERVKKNYGVYKGEVLRKWIEGKFFKKTGIKNCTFLELHKLSHGDKRFKDIYSVALNIDTGFLETFNYIDTPDVIISDVVRASSSIPGFFEAFEICCKNKKGQRVSVQGQLKGKYVDGGLINNFPTEIFHDVDSSRVLGFYLCDSNVAAYLKRVKECPRKNVEDLSGYFKKAISILYNQQYSSFMGNKRLQALTIPIDNTGISIIDFDIKDHPENFERLLRSGWDSACWYFNSPIPYPKQVIDGPKGSFDALVLKHQFKNNSISNFFPRLFSKFYKTPRQKRNALAAGGSLFLFLGSNISFKNAFIFFAVSVFALEIANEVYKPSRGQRKH